MTANEAAEAAKAVQRTWRTSRLVLAAYAAVGTLVLCCIAAADPAVVINGAGLFLAVAAGIGILQFIFWRYRIAKGKTLAEATRNSERYDLTSPEALYYSSHGYARIRTGSYRMGSIDLTRLRALTSFQYVAVIIAGFGLASVVASAIVNHSPTATTIATVNQCYTAKGGAYCTGTWTVAGQTYSATLWGNGNTGSRPEPAVGSALTVTYDTRYPSVLGTQSVGGGVFATVVAALMATGLWFWGNTWYKPYRAAVDAIAASPSAAAAARRPAPHQPPAHDGS